MQSTKKAAGNLVFLCAAIYFISYMTRINYGTVISEMVTGTGLAKSVLSTALTGSAVTYGIGQLISGFLGDRIQPKKLVAMGLITTAAMNLLLPLCGDPMQMTAVWCVNGFAQAMMWPPLTKLLATQLTVPEYNHGIVRVSWGSSFGTIFLYLSAPLLIMVGSWKWVFVFSAVFAVMGLLLWWKNCPTIALSAPAGKQKASGGGQVFLPLLLLVMAAIVLQGILRDGVTTWMPSYISETYNLSNAISILTGVLLPIFSVLCNNLTGHLYEKKLKNPLLSAGVIFGVGAAAALLLSLFSSQSAAVSIFLSALLTGCMHGVNLLLVCMMPPLLAKSGKVSTISGILNFSAYIGAALSAYVFPLVAESSGWTATIRLWLAAAVAGTLICLLSLPLWKRISGKKG